MRIIRGKFQRRIIQVPAGLPVRPTTDMAKESLFNLLENEVDFEGLRALDLFAGTGNISYELVSRGCSHVLAVDQHPKCVQFIAQTAKNFNMPELQVIRSDVFRFLATVRMPYDIIFADPPYELELGQYQQIVSTVFDQNLLTQAGVLVVEHSKRVDFMDHPALFDMRHYGKVHFSFFGNEV